MCWSTHLAIWGSHVACVTELSHATRRVPEAITKSSVKFVSHVSHLRYTSFGRGALVAI